MAERFLLFHEWLDKVGIDMRVNAHRLEIADHGPWNKLLQATMEADTVEAETALQELQSVEAQRAN